MIAKEVFSAMMTNVWDTMKERRASLTMSAMWVFTVNLPRRNAQSKSKRVELGENRIQIVSTTQNASGRRVTF